MQQKTTKTDSLVLCIEVMQGWITGWNVVWITRGERVNVQRLGAKTSNIKRCDKKCAQALTLLVRHFF